MPQTTVDWLAQCVGIVALILACLSFQVKTSKGILRLQVIANCLWITHYLLIEDGNTGAILNLFAAVRNVTYFYLNKKEKGNRMYYSIGFAILCIALSLMTYESWVSLLPMVGSTLQTFAMSCRKANNLRWMTLSGMPFWLSYNILVHSTAGAITETISIISILIGLIRYRKVKEE